MCSCLDRVFLLVLAEPLPMFGLLGELALITLVEEELWIVIIFLTLCMSCLTPFAHRQI
jgi:hypothetical protein